MTPATWGDVLLSLWPQIVAVIAILTALLILVRAAEWLARRAGRRARLRDLTGDGDGQGGVPPIARRLAAAEALTEAISMRGLPDSWTTRPDGIVPLDQLVVNAEFERMASQVHWDSVRDALDGDDAG